MDALTGLKFSWSSLFESFRDFCAESFEDIASEEGMPIGDSGYHLKETAAKIRAATDIYGIQEAFKAFGGPDEISMFLDYLDRWLEPHTSALKAQNLKFSWAVDPVQEAALKEALLKIYDSVAYNVPMKLQDTLYSYYALVLKELKEVFLKYGPILQQKGIITDPMILIEEAEKELDDWEDKTPPHFIIGFEMLLDEGGFLE